MLFFFPSASNVLVGTREKEVYYYFISLPSLPLLLLLLLSLLLLLLLLLLSSLFTNVFVLDQIFLQCIPNFSVIVIALQTICLPPFLPSCYLFVRSFANVCFICLLSVSIFWTVEPALHPPSKLVWQSTSHNPGSKRQANITSLFYTIFLKSWVFWSFFNRKMWQVNDIINWSFVEIHWKNKR